MEIQFEQYNLSGFIRTHLNPEQTDIESFSKDLEKLMIEHKVVKVDVCFDPFKYNKGCKK